ncbi:hypothetical protein ASU33_04675 [Solirubrum puertoriconensis]|uniref:Outer membrane protein beta-barrel domain-containing protein n=1 Tax=Solirubrum puertoriconensis TaxID=1751427 RepID=A0A9X0HIU9_SOLP1|nr:hypothetical protein ASU33_04675 [Solirubrum puertoriconensis]
MGATLTTLSSRPERYPSRYSPLAGAQVGLAGQWQWGAVRLQTAMLYTQKGARQRTQYALPSPTGELLYDYRIRTRFGYLEVPLHLAVAPVWARYLQVFAGPYLAMGVGGQFEQEYQPTGGQNQPVREARPLEYTAFMKSYADAQRYDTGISAGLGYQTGPVLLQAQYSWAWQNNRPAWYSGPGTARYHRTAALALTYLLPRGT